MDTQQRRHIAQAIKTARLRHGWTTTEAAARLDTSDANWSRWETGHATPRPATLLKLGELLGLPDGWWEMPAETTLSQPSRTVDADELLATIRRELAEHEARVEAMLARLTGGSHDNADSETRAGRQRRNLESVDGPHASRAAEDSD